jgi:hypothetical protein
MSNKKLIKEVLCAEQICKDLDHTGSPVFGYFGGAVRLAKELDQAERWFDNEVQFARLICELVANVDNLEFELVAESMDLSKKELISLYDRANAVWERAKREV